MSMTSKRPGFIKDYMLPTQSSTLSTVESTTVLDYTLKINEVKKKTTSTTSTVAVSSRHTTAESLLDIDPNYFIDSLKRHKVAIIITALLIVILILGAIIIGKRLAEKASRRNRPQERLLPLDQTKTTTKNVSSQNNESNRYVIIRTENKNTAQDTCENVCELNDSDKSKNRNTLNEYFDIDEETLKKNEYLSAAFIAQAAKLSQNAENRTNTTTKTEEQENRESVYLSPNF